jgi:lipopolysaccharide/colanic/teichoic acid biosynthesis glycosyltransferase
MSKTSTPLRNNRLPASEGMSALAAGGREEGRARPELTASLSPVRPAPSVRSRWDAVSDRNVRRLNVASAAIGLVLAAPLMIGIALAVKLTSRGPILYRQERVGQDRRRNRGPGMENGRRQTNGGGRIFTMYKFRTMFVGSDKAQVWASADDPRITWVGRFLRRYRLDELPQLLNVLRGDMNIVGPRPEQPEIFLELRRQVEGYSQRQMVLPGITGWAQVNHHYDQCLDDVRRKVGLDLEYIQRRSPAEDLRIMARTLPVMVGRKGSL